MSVPVEVSVEVLNRVKYRTGDCGEKMAISRNVAAVGMIVVAVIAFAVGLYANPLVFPPTTEEDPIWTGVLDAGKFKVGTEPGWPPYQFKNATGHIVGFEIDLMEMIADELDLDVEWVDMGFDAIIPAVQSKEIDLGVSGFSITADRLLVIEFTSYHSITEGQVIMLESEALAKGITEMEYLSNLTDYGLTCGTQVGTTQQGELSDIAPSALVTYDDFLLALEAMKNKLVDSIYAETPITSNWILEADQAGEEPIVIVFRRPYYPVAFVAHKDADKLVSMVNGALAEIIATGRLDELKQKWKT